MTGLISQYRELYRRWGVLESEGWRLEAAREMFDMSKRVDEILRQGDFDDNTGSEIREQARLLLGYARVPLEVRVWAWTLEGQTPEDATEGISDTWSNYC